MVAADLWGIHLVHNLGIGVSKDVDKNQERNIVGDGLPDIIKHFLLFLVDVLWIIIFVEAVVVLTGWFVWIFSQFPAKNDSVTIVIIRHNRHNIFPTDPATSHLPPTSKILRSAPYI